MVPSLRASAILIHIPCDFFLCAEPPLRRKRHICWSNTSQIGRLDRGKLSKAMRESCIVKTTKKVNKNGKITFSGNKFLKQTQPVT